MRISDWSSDVCSSDLLKAMVLAGLEREARMQHIIDQITRTTFGKRSEKLSEDQLALAFDDLDVARAELEALGEQAAGQKKERARRESGTARGSLPAHLTRIEEVILPDERSEEHTSELQSLMRISYAVFCLKKTNNRRVSQDKTS